MQHRATLALALLPGIGPVQQHDLIARFGTAARAFDEVCPPALRSEVLRRADEALAKACGLGARVLSPGDSDYPAKLSELRDPPNPLFALGDVGLLGRPCAAIVGTRSATSYGERVTRALAAGLARAGVVIVSGMARGIDAAAHRAVLECRGGTIAVLGTGLAVAYPKAHRVLQAEVAKQGLLLSEEMPSDRAGAGSFPRRNRILAALSDVTLVVEAGFRSGALITANHALELGRTVAAVPGPIDSPASGGTNALLRDGAITIADLADALSLFGLAAASPAEPALADPSERSVWDALAAGPADADTLAARASLPARYCLAAISALELAGLVECTLSGEVRRR